MKKAFVLFITLLCFAVITKAQDIIKLTNGTEIRAKVLEVNPSDIKYKDFSNQDGPIITIDKSTVASIRYANGTQTLFNASSSDKPTGGHFVRGSGERNEKSRSTDNDGDKYVSYRRKKQQTTLHGWYFGLELPIGGSYANSTATDYSTSSGSYFGLHLMATKMFNPHIGIQFGFGSEGYDYGVTFNNTSTFGYGDDVFGLTYYTIPVRVLYFSNSKGKIGFFANVGFDFSILGAASDNENDQLGNYFKSGVVSPFISCGADFRSRNGRSAWLIGPFFKTSLGNFYTSKADANNYLYPGNTGSLQSFGFYVNYMFKFRGQRV